MKRLLPLCLALCLPLCACQALPYPRDLEDTLLVRTLGVDWTGEGVVLTAAGGGEDGAAPQVLTARGADFEQGIQALKRAGEESVALTHVTQLVVGADSELRRVLEGALAQRELGQSATVWLAGESAQSLMTAVGGGARRLTSLELNTPGLRTATVLETLARLEEGEEVLLPLLYVRGGVLEVMA